MSVETGTGGKPFEPTAEDLELIARAREQFRKLDSLPRVSKEMQKRVNSEMGLDDQSEGDRQVAPPRESGKE